MVANSKFCSLQVTKSHAILKRERHMRLANSKLATPALYTSTL